ncbi:hypothetical protein Bca4012_023224 [Brassica carinata]
MSSSAAQINVLGGIGIATSCSSSKRNLNGKVSFMPFFGTRNGTFTTPSSAAFLRMSSRHGCPVRRVFNEKVVGIDLGTTNSVVAVMEGGKPTIVNAEGQRTTPSVVAFTKSGDRLVGQSAKRQAVVNPENTFSSVKRFIGRSVNEVDEEAKQVSYRVNRNVKLECPAIVLEVDEGVFQVVSTSGDTHLGGDDFDKRVVDWLASKFKKSKRIHLLKDKQALQRLTEAAEKAKIELSSLTQTNISLPFIKARDDGPKHIETTLTRAKFEELCSDLLDRCKTPVENSLRDAMLRYSDIDEVILVGGSTRIPAVQEVVRNLTGKEPNLTVNPDEVVALGAAVQASVLAGDVSDIFLLDVTPFSLASKSKVFTTVSDGETRVRINVVQGEREFVKDNKSLGSFVLDGIPPAPRRKLKIDVKFEIDANGILSASATDRATGNKQEITINGATLPKDEVEKMVKEAERFAKDDKVKREAIDTKNQADSVVYQTEKHLKKIGEKIPGEVKEKVEAKLQELMDKIGSGSTQETKDSMAALKQEVMQIGQSMYNQPRVGAGAGEGPRW